ncbi:MAG: polysialyltransferase family glycosyltransferase [Campylobacterota bacterium]|nr:polysialyltransferase family glycosyltransferase [Campylobacterota bacterium]
MNNTVWINKLFDGYVQDSSVPLLFEQKDRLKEKEPVLNLSIHPLRFADDIFFNFQTNDPKLKKRLQKYEVNYNIFYTYADIQKASFIKNVKNNTIKENSILLIGQTPMDKTVYDGTKYLLLTDFITQIQNISKKYHHIYFKPHPYAKNTNKLLKELKKYIPNIKITYDNIYHLLSNDNIKHIAGLNSSVLYEAKYFKKEVTFLYKPYFDFDKEDIGVYGNYFDSSFWADILQTDDKNISIPFSPNRLRKSLNDFWGYSQISDEIILKDIIKSKIKYLLMKYF